MPGRCHSSPSSIEFHGLTDRPGRTIYSLQPLASRSARRIRLGATALGRGRSRERLIPVGGGRRVEMKSVLSRVAAISPKLCLLLALLLPWPAFAASTGDTSLLVVQGGGANTELGDYISTDDGAGLNTYYSFFIEVP